MPDQKAETPTKRPPDTLEYLVARRKAYHRGHREPDDRRDMICLSCGRPYRFNAADERDSTLVCLDCATELTQAEEEAMANQAERDRERRLAGTR